MKEVSAELRKGYIAKLAGLQLDGVTIPVSDSFAAVSAKDKYVFVSAQNSIDISDKNVFKHDCSITLDIVTKFPAPLMGGSITSERISDKILQLIYPHSTLDYVQADGFQVLTTYLDGNTSLNTDAGTIKEFRKILIFRHILIQI